MIYINLNALMVTRTTLVSIPFGRSEHAKRDTPAKDTPAKVTGGEYGGKYYGLDVSQVILSLSPPISRRTR